MKKTYMLKYFISFFAIISYLNCSSQEQNMDSIYKSTYGIKLGIDFSKQVRMLTEPEYKGIVIIGDYRVLDKLYIAVEFGSEEKLVENEVLNFKTKGSFYKAGANYNIFKNIQNLENEIYIGLRYGSSKFDHNLNSFTIHNVDQYWNQNNITNSSSYENLNAKWLEFLVGFKAQVIDNFYMGLNLNVKRILSQKSPENFSYLYIPGFNKD